MELTKQGQPPPPRPLPSASPRSAHPTAFYLDNWGAQVPASSFLIVPMSQQQPAAAQVGVPRPTAPQRPPSRVSLLPPQQVLSVQTSLPGMAPSPPSAGKKTAVSPKVQMLNSVPLQSSAGKRSVQKALPPRANPQLVESVRWKYRETLAAALSVDSEQMSPQQSAGNVSPVGSAGGKMQALGDSTLQGPTATSSQDAGIRVSLEDGVLSNSTVALDDLLQGDGRASEDMSQPNSKRLRISDVSAGVHESQMRPEYKRTKPADKVTEEKKGGIQKAQILAFRIEEELFKLFGGVNKKYKEKGRSLLFNLKDKSNPVLRERVFSGDITPKCLCAMTIEQLASKELSDWRVAKAEELAKMVVLPDKQVDVRSLVRKTHKGEFQVEMEETDGISVEVGLGGDLFSHVPSKPIDVDGQTKSDDTASLHSEDKELDNTEQDGVAGSCHINMLSNLECTPNENTDVMQELMVDDLMDTKSLPQIMSLDEFMEAHDSDSLLEDHSAEAMQDDPNSIDKVQTELKPEKTIITEDKAAASEFQIDSDAPSPEDNCESNLDSPRNESLSILDPAKQQKVELLVKSSHEKVNAEKPDTVSCLIPESAMQCQASPDAALRSDSIWDGKIQLTSSSLTNVVAIFKSGEKPSTNEWRRIVEIKGRVRLSAFEEFLEQLPQSRSRATMVIELRWKEGSLESGQKHLIQTMDSYIADERVGLVKPAEGVELYLCPPEGKAAQILADHLPKEHSGSLTVSGASVIGVVVWRRPHVSPSLPNRQDGSTRQSISKKPQAVISSSVPMPSQSTKFHGPSSAPSSAHRHHQDVVTAEVPPGFGSVVVRDYDDLPEYDFVSVSNAAANATTSQACRSQQHVQAAPLPMDQVKELIRKYGSRSVAAQAWNDNVIPAWDPNQSNLQQTRHPQLQLPLPPPVQSMHAHYQQQQQQYHSVQLYHITQESYTPLPQAYAEPQHISTSVAEQQPAYGHLVQPGQAQSGQLGWQTNVQWVATHAPHEATTQTQNVVQQSYFSVVPDGSGQAHATVNQGAMAWKPQ